MDEMPHIVLCFERKMTSWPGMLSERTSGLSVGGFQEVAQFWSEKKIGVSSVDFSQEVRGSTESERI